MHPKNIEEFIDPAQYTERFELNLSKGLIRAFSEIFTTLSTNLLLFFVLDKSAREYWFTSIQKLVDTFYNQALKSQQHNSDAVVRCNQYRDEYKNILQHQQQLSFHNSFPSNLNSNQSLFTFR